MADLTLDEVERLLEMADHPSTPRSIRSRLGSLRARAISSPKRALERFEELAGSVLADLPVDVPERTLYRAQSLPTFLRHCAKPAYQGLDPETFRRRVERSSDPDGMLSSVLDDEAIVFPRRRSWMVAASDAIREASGDELVRMLELGRQHPPFALCVMPPRLLVDADVKIRPPTAADAALGGHDYWRPNAVSAGPEFIDLNVSGSAVEEVLWRP